MFDVKKVLREREREREMEGKVCYNLLTFKDHRGGVASSIHRWHCDSNTHRFLSVRILHYSMVMTSWMSLHSLVLIIIPIPN